MNLTKILTNTILAAIIALPSSVAALPSTLVEMQKWAASNAATESAVEEKVRKTGKEIPRNEAGLSLQVMLQCSTPSNEDYLTSWGLWVEDQLALWQAVLKGMQGQSVRVPNNFVVEFESMVWKRAKLTEKETAYMLDQLTMIFRDCLKEATI